MFSKALWSSRLLTYLPVVFSLFGAALLFLIASLDIWHVVTYTFNMLVSNAHPKDFHEVIVGDIIGAIDLYLIAVVMLLFSFGIYELFIAEIEEAKESTASKVLVIHSLDQLKDKLAKVIVMVLIVSFFRQVLHTEYKSALEMLYFAGSIFALAFALYYLHKGGKH